MPKSTQQLQTIRTEGALLPPDILQRIASLKVDGVRPADYHLPEGFRINDAITQSWDILKKHWKNFQEAREQLSDTEHGTSVTNERWLLPLFKELEYGRLSTSPSPQIEDRSYPIERFYNHTPIHLIGCNLPMDRRTKGARGAATSSPHSMMQEFLNRSDQHQWGFLSNGRQLRILRDNVSLSRQAYLEFDLEGMMDGEVYGDFVLLWLLCHQSRVEAERVDDCWLEKWSKLAREEGTRVLNNLRTGVTRAIELLGQGFIAHPHNDELRSKLQESGTLTKEDLYRQLLRIVYRLLFLFVAEDRRLLHPPVAEEAACELYDRYYSTRRLREMAFKLRGSKHSDLWHSLSLIFHGLHRDNGLPELGLPALGSFLWDPQKTADLLGPAQIVSVIPSTPDKGERARVRGPSELQTPVFISNDDLLAAIRTLAYVAQDKVLRDVDYRNLDTEEFGSVYESLLELHPVMHVEAKTFSLNTAWGNERKTSGSYYTDDSLVQCLLDSALDPVIAERLKGLKGKEAEDAILKIKVCDPACGSGHFLIGAARRLARHLARIRTGESEPVPDEYQRALRDVISRCIYGVDINPMAVELCKVSLWMEALDPGRPLSFLDHHIQVGNSLLGVTPRLLSDGIPDDAFNAIEGDVKSMASGLKAQNKKERAEYRQASGKLQKVMFGGDPFIKLGNLPSEFMRLSSSSDHSIMDVAAKEQWYTKLVCGADYQNACLLADTWCAVFVWQKDTSDLGKLCPTERDFRKIENNPHCILPHVKTEVRRLADQYQFFHWHLAFPDVFRLPEGEDKAENEESGWNAGFDVILGNPPWEMVEAESQGTSTSEDEAEHGEAPLPAPTSDRLRLIHGTQLFASESGRFPHTAGGRKNLYALFVELASTLSSQFGRVGQVAPTGVIQEDPAEKLARHLFCTHRVASVFEFQNKRSPPYEGKWFEDVHPQYRICLLTLARDSCQTEFVFDFSDLSEICDPQRRYLQSYDEINKFCADKFKVPMFRNSREAAVCSKAYRNGDVLGKLSEGNSPAIRSGLIFNFGKKEKAQKIPFHSADDGYVAVYEGEYLHQFNHRFATTNTSESQYTTGKELADGNFRIATAVALPASFTADRLQFVAKRPVNWIVCLRRQARSTDSFISISAVIPAVAVEGSLTAFFEEPENAPTAGSLCANLNSFAANFMLSLRQSGPNVNKGVYEQIPLSQHIARPDLTAGWTENTVLNWITPRVLELTYTAWDLEAFAGGCGYSGPPFRWDEERRFLLRCELDAAYFHLYLGSPTEWGTDSPQLREMLPTPRHAVDYIMETFPIIKRKDIKRSEILNDQGEVATEGTYITKDTILAIYDEMQTAINTGTPYQTHLSPPPGPPTDSEGNFIPSTEWDTNNWPSHIHTPRSDRFSST